MLITLLSHNNSYGGGSLHPVCCIPAPPTSFYSCHCSIKHSHWVSHPQNFLLHSSTCASYPALHAFYLRQSMSLSIALQFLRHVFQLGKNLLANMLSKLECNYNNNSFCHELQTLWPNYCGQAIALLPESEPISFHFPSCYSHTILCLYCVPDFNVQPHTWPQIFVVWSDRQDGVSLSFHAQETAGLRVKLVIFNDQRLAITSYK